jgi:hypothetical protein
MKRIFIQSVRQRHRPNSQSCIAAGLRQHADDFRSGSTLTEVLVSLLIMSIGIFGVISLFPLSIQRSIRATTLTHGTDLRYNAEAFLELLPRMIGDPDLDGVTGVPIEYVGPTGASNYVIDPVGWMAMELENPTPPSAPFRDYFGNTLGTNPQLPPPAAPPFPLPRRYNFRKTTAPAAAALATMPDSWAWQYEDYSANPALDPGLTAVTLNNFGPTQIDVNGLGASGFTMAPGVNYRAIIYSADGQSSQVRTITQVNVDTIKWTEDINDSGNPIPDAGEDAPLPAGRGNGNGAIDHYPLPIPSVFTPGKVLIESQDPRYTWLMTIRRQASGTADIDIVVYFSRPLNDLRNEEQTYTAVFSKGTKQVNVDYTANGTAPFARRGSYVFDADNARWYRITQVVDNKSGQMTLQIELPAYASSPIPANGGGRAMFPRGVVDVYPIGTKIP